MRTGRQLCFATGIALLLTVVAGPSLAGIPNASCRTPFAFSDAGVNVLVLPYFDETGRLGATGSRLTLLLQQQLLVQLAPLGSVGTVRLLGDDADCDLERIKPRVGQMVSSKGQAVFFVRGRLFEESGTIRVQSFVTFEVMGGLPELRVDVAGTQFALRLPDTSITFFPRTMSTSDLTALDRAFEKDARLYDSPDEHSRSRPLPVGLGSAETPYKVVELRGDWTRVEGLGIGSGWLRARAELQSGTLSERMPELALVEAIAATLRARQEGRRNQVDRVAKLVGLRKAADRAAARFEASTGGEEDEQALAWAAVIQAVTKLDADPSVAGATAAKPYLDHAVELTPEDPATRAMRAAVLLKLCDGGASGADQTLWKRAEKDLLVATALSKDGSSSRQYVAELAGLAIPKNWSPTAKASVEADQDSLRRIGISPRSTDPAICRGSPATTVIPSSFAIEPPPHGPIQNLVVCREGIVSIRARGPVDWVSLRSQTADVGVRRVGLWEWETAAPIQAGTVLELTGFPSSSAHTMPAPPQPVFFDVRVKTTH